MSSSVAKKPLVGIEKLSIYPCSLSLSMRTLAQARGVDESHPIDELMVETRSLNPVWEDPVTMAVNAAMNMLDDEDRASIEMVVVGSESGVDFGKPMATWVQRFCGIQPRCRTFETKHACYGGSAAVMMAAHWVASQMRPGAKALVVCTDQSRMHLGKPWEFVLGAGACAMLISADPKLVHFDLARNGYWTSEISDTYRPTSRNEVGHADTSLFAYLDALDGAYEHFSQQMGPDFDYEKEFAKHIYHVPFGGMTLRAHKAIMRKVRAMKNAEALAHWSARTKPSLVYNRLLGGSYTSATFLALAGMLDTSNDLKAGDRISIFSYGSGSCAEFYGVTVDERAKAYMEKANHAQRFAAREPISVADYETVEQARAELIDRPNYTVSTTGLNDLYERVYAGQKKLVLRGINDWERHYELS
jgi:hydroxymethylglutaryl-CoA synthase